MVKNILESIAKTSFSPRRALRNFALSGAAALTIMACSKSEDPDPYVPPPPPPNPEVVNYSLFVVSPKVGAAVEAYKNNKLLDDAVINEENGATIQFSSLDLSSSAKESNPAGKSASTAKAAAEVELDSLLLKYPGYETEVILDAVAKSGTEVKNTYEVDITIDPNQTGDFAIEPIYKGSPIDSVIVSATYINDPEESPSPIVLGANEYQAIFNDVLIPDTDNPADYQIVITSNKQIPEFPQTIVNFDIFQDEEGEINGSKVVTLEELANEQDITLEVNAGSTYTDFPNVNVQVFNADTNEIITSGTTDGLGELIFEDVPGNTNIYFKYDFNGVFEGSEYYKVTSGTYSVPTVDTPSETSNRLRVVARRKTNFTDGTPMPASIVNLYQPKAYNTEAALRHWRVYFPANGARDDVISWFDENLQAIGSPETLIVSSSPFEVLAPGNPLYDNYDPFGEVFEGQIGSNVDNYSGTAVSTVDKLIEDVQITMATDVFELGPTRASTDHEFGNALGFPLLGKSQLGYDTSRTADGGESIPLKDSRGDSPAMRTHMLDAVDWVLGQSFKPPKTYED